jgi:RTX calcium-binding nonapeptide repeat (4 copies)
VARFRGGSLANWYTGTDGRDVVRGLGGDDTLYGSGGDDYLNAGAGNDWAQGDDGDDSIHGGTGDDAVIYHGRSADVLHGGAGDDFLVHFGGDAEVFGDRGDDTIQVSTGRADGGPGADFLRGWAVDQGSPHGYAWAELVGGRGADVFEVFSADDVPGAAPVTGWVDVYDYTPGEGDQLVFGHDFRDPAIEDDLQSPEILAVLDDNDDGRVDDADGHAWFDGRALQVELPNVGSDGAVETLDGDRLVLWGHDHIDFAGLAA